MSAKFREISNSDNIVDSRDVIKRINELESLRDDWQSDNDLPEYLDTNKPTSNNKAVELKWKDSDFDKWAEWDESDEGEELKALLSLQEQAEGYGDWSHGETLIRDSYMDTDWARSELDSLGYLDKNIPDIISSNINWDGILDDLKQDYTEVDWDGETYWMRS